jgi:hypothetical protein
VAGGLADLRVASGKAFPISRGIPAERLARLDWMKCIPENCQFTIAHGAQADLHIPLY